MTTAMLGYRVYIKRAANSTETTEGERFLTYGLIEVLIVHN